MDAKHYIESLALEPHREGGYYRRLFGTERTADGSISSIYYLLEGRDFSAFHRLHGMTEIWYYHAGEPINIYVIDADGRLATHRLSPIDEMQVVILSGQWFAADIPSGQGFCLVGCAVAPAFDYADFELGKRQDLLNQYPQYASIINRLCRE